jgi:Zn-finger nucleic acid-binding protein
MRQNRTILMCPSCGKQNVFQEEYDIEGRECHNCDWRGHMDKLVREEFHVERVAHIKISCDIIDRIVYRYYGHSDGKFAIPHFEMACNGEWSNDTSHQFTVEPKVGSYEAEDAAKFRKDGKPRGLSNGDVLNILCQDGWLEPGEYLVEVCW